MRLSTSRFKGCAKQPTASCLVVIASLAVCMTPLAIAQQETISRVERQEIQAITSNTGMVVSETPLASEIGADILEQGGSAADAAIAVAFALAVTWPEAGNLAGGGFMMVAAPDDEDVWCVDYRETAPAAATPDMFMGKKTRFWHGQVGVPGTVAGMALAHDRWGKLKWADLVLPSAKLADEGFEVNQALALSLNEVLNKKLLKKSPERFTELVRVYGKPDGSPWKAGDHIALPDLAKTLYTLAERGPDAFYTGPLAEAIADDMSKNDGLITMNDLAEYRAILRPAVKATFHGYDVFGPPPPSAGGLTLGMMLHQLEALPLTDHPRYSGQAMHLMAEAMRRAYHRRALNIGDGDFVDIPAELATPAFGKQLASTIDTQKATPSNTLTPTIPLADESPDTTHFSVIDADGLAISNTYTLEMSWGSRMITANTGIVLNNEMGDFNREPGVTKTSGQIGTPPNTIAPGKRMLSSQTPTLVKKDGDVVLLTGSPGGRTITNTVLNVLVSHIAYGMPLADAVDGPRLHHQWFPDQIKLENMDDPNLAETVAHLQSLGHKVVEGGRQGSANSISVDPGTSTYTGVPDWRRGAAASAPQPALEKSTSN